LQRMSGFDPTKWYLVYSKSRKEEFAESCLRLRGIEVFLPRLFYPTGQKNPRNIVPLFPNYLFTRIHDAEQYQKVIWTPGVRRLISFNGFPACLDDTVVGFLRRHATPEGFIPARSNLKVGEEIHITGGPFDGLVGIIQEPPESKQRVSVLMKLLSRDIKVELPVKFIDSNWVPRLTFAGTDSSYLNVIN
jgi:transcriptional antiterminator RfaH